MAYTYQEGLPPDALARYKRKLACVGVDQCPFKEPADRWINDPQQWPKISYADVYNYLIESPRIFSAEAMKNYRSLEAHVFFVSGWVQTVYHLKSRSGIMILKADVKPSWRVTEEPHHPWVALKKDGPVLAAHCDCMAGLGETCSHIGALLFKMEAAVRLGYTSSACTDVPCVWNQCFVKNVQPAPVANIKFYSAKAKQKLKETKRNPRLLPTPSTDIEQRDFLNSLKSLDANIVGLSAFKEHCANFVGIGPSVNTKRLPANLRDLYCKDNSSLREEDIITLSNRTFDQFSVTSEEIKYVEEVTKTQSLSSAWHQVRLGRITASVAGEVMRSNVQKPSVSLIKKICVPRDQPLRVPAIDWGREHEDHAFRLYGSILHKTNVSVNEYPSGNVYIVNLQEQHTEGILEKTGFHISAEKPYIGASPDGLTNCACCGQGVIEIKCPYSVRQMTLKEAVTDASFYLDQRFTLKPHHMYFSQVQMQMYICDAKYCDFIVWTPIDCVITRVMRNDDYMCDMMVTIESFWRFSVLPELLTRREENKPATQVLQDISNKGERTFCICNSTSEEGDMVGCDKCDQWFHLSCLKLKRLPQTKTWYCKKCRRTMKK